MCSVPGQQVNTAEIPPQQCADTVVKASPDIKGFDTPDLQASSKSGSRLGHLPGSFNWVTGTTLRCANSWSSGLHSGG